MVSTGEEEQWMTAKPLNRQFAKPDETVIAWLLDSDPAIRWQIGYYPLKRMAIA